MGQIENNSKILSLNSIQSMITLNANDLNTLMQSQRWSDWIKNNIYIYSTNERPSSIHIGKCKMIERR